MATHSLIQKALSVASKSYKLETPVVVDREQFKHPERDEIV